MLARFRFTMHEALITLGKGVKMMLIRQHVESSGVSFLGEF